MEKGETPQNEEQINPKDLNSEGLNLGDENSAEENRAEQALREPSFLEAEAAIEAGAKSEAGEESEKKDYKWKTKTKVFVGASILTLGILAAGTSEKFFVSEPKPKPAVAAKDSDLANRLKILDSELKNKHAEDEAKKAEAKKEIEQAEKDIAEKVEAKKGTEVLEETLPKIIKPDSPSLIEPKLEKEEPADSQQKFEDEPAASPQKQKSWQEQITESFVNGFKEFLKIDNETKKEEKAPENKKIETRETEIVITPQTKTDDSAENLEPKEVSQEEKMNKMLSYWIKDSKAVELPDGYFAVDIGKGAAYRISKEDLDKGIKSCYSGFDNLVKTAMSHRMASSPGQVTDRIRENMGQQLRKKIIEYCDQIPEEDLPEKAKEKLKKGSEEVKPYL